jgi:hypothetical protein
MASDVTVVGAVCMRCSHNKRADLDKHEHYIREAARNGVKLLVFPEVAVQGYITSWGDPTRANGRRWHLDPGAPARQRARRTWRALLLHA